MGRGRRESVASERGASAKRAETKSAASGLSAAAAPKRAARSAGRHSSSFGASEGKRGAEREAAPGEARRQRRDWYRDYKRKGGQAGDGHFAGNRRIAGRQEMAGNEGGGVGEENEADCSTAAFRTVPTLGPATALSRVQSRAAVTQRGRQASRYHPLR